MFTPAKVMERCATHLGCSALEPGELQEDGAKPDSANYLRLGVARWTIFWLRRAWASFIEQEALIEFSLSASASKLPSLCHQDGIHSFCHFGSSNIATGGTAIEKR